MILTLKLCFKKIIPTCNIIIFDNIFGVSGVLDNNKNKLKYNYDYNKRNIEILDNLINIEYIVVYYLTDNIKDIRKMKYNEIFDKNNHIT